MNEQIITHNVIAHLVALVLSKNSALRTRVFIVPTQYTLVHMNAKHLCRARFSFHAFQFIVLNENGKNVRHLAVSIAFEMFQTLYYTVNWRVHAV